MPTGLTSEQLMTLFGQCLQARADKFTSDVQAANHGESPQVAEVLAALKTQFPTVSIEQLGTVGCIFWALMDTIAGNNDALAKVIPRVDF